MKILKGKEFLDNIKKDIHSKLLNIAPINRPSIAILINEDDYGSLQYARQLTKDCNEVGIGVISVKINSNTNIDFIYRTITDFNYMEDVAAIMIQHPLPKTLSKCENEIIDSVDSNKLIDAPFWKMKLDSRKTWPGTPHGVYLMLTDYYKSDLTGKKVVVIGRSKTVGMPLSMILTYNGATVTNCHSKTGMNNIREYCKSADIIISAAGSPGLIDNTFTLNENQVIIDVGCNQVDGKLCGDVKFDDIAHIVEAITPVPGGVGPMTRAAILSSIIMNS